MNRLFGTILDLATEGAFSLVRIDVAGARLHSLISAQAARDLELRPGAPVHALIKATEVGLAEGHVRA